MTDLNIIPGDLEALRGGADAVAEALGSAPFGARWQERASRAPGLPEHRRRMGCARAGP